MPKLTRRAMGRPADAPISVIGGLSFFGGPGSNYLTHALATMVERIRDRRRHRCRRTASACSTRSTTPWCWPTIRAPTGAIPGPVHDVGAARPPVEAPVAVVEDYAGPGTILTCTVMFGRDGRPERGAVIGTGAGGERFAARIDPAGDTLDELDLRVGAGRPGRDGHGRRHSGIPPVGATVRLDVCTCRRRKW